MFRISRLSNERGSRRKNDVRNFRDDLQGCIFGRSKYRKSYFWKGLTMPSSASGPSEPIGLAVEIVSAFVARNSLPSAQLPVLIQSVHAALLNIVSSNVTPSTVGASQRQSRR